MQCPKCGYQPTAQEHATSREQCPSCGIYYAKFIAQLKAKASAVTQSENLRAAPKVKTIGANSFVAQSLSNGEHVISFFKLHWIVWVMVAVWFLLAIPTAGLTILVAIYDILRIKSTEHALTNKRVIYKVGIISRKTQEMRITSLETIEINQGVFGRIFGYGKVRVTGRGTSDVTFHAIADPMDVKRRIESVCNPID